MRSILREPVAVFLVVAGAIVGLYVWLGPDDRDPRAIAVTPAVREGIAAEHQRRTGRSATPAEAEGLLARWIEDEALYREALDLGLDRGDVIVRRRLQQKMEMVAEAQAVPEPTEAELAAYLAAHAERWGVPERVSFEHVYVSTERHRAAAPDVAEAHRTALVAGADPRTLGDAFLRGREQASLSRGEIAAVFGPSFADAVMPLPAAEWSAPIRSSYGLHLVRVRERTPPRPAALAEVRNAVRGAWIEERRMEARRTLLESLRQRWPVTIEGRG